MNLRAIQHNPSRRTLLVANNHLKKSKKKFWMKFLEIVSHIIPVNDGQKGGVGAGGKLYNKSEKEEK